MNTSTSSMTTAPAATPVRRMPAFRARPLAALGAWAALLLRAMMAVFFTNAGYNKVTKAWMTSDVLQRNFLQRLEELDPDSLGARFLENVAIPHFQVFAAMVTLGEVAIAIGLVFGFVTRGAAIGAMLLMLSFAFGGYYDASLIFLTLMFLPIALTPNGHWFGVDGPLHARYPRSILFR
jgi:thiosulfate dehydrogenase [quinone] large subunit